MSDEVRAERSPDEWPNMYGRYGVRVRGYGCDSFVFFVRESDAEAFIAKVNGTGLRIVDAAGNLPPWPDLTELTVAVDGVFEHAERYMRGESSIETVEQARANVFACAIALVERHR
jgi:hypothetical protein